MQVAKIIEFCFAHRAAIEKAIREKRMDPAVPKTGGAAGNAQRSDPTCQKALRNIAEVSCVEIPYGASVNGRQDVFTLRRPERWLRVVDLTFEHYRGKLEANLITAKYVQCKSREEVCAELCIGKSLYHVMQNDIFCFATGAAAGLGLVVPRR